MEKKTENGAITVEACVVLTLFIFLILTLYSFFMIFEAQGKIADTALKCAESMSLDPLVTEQINWDVDSVNGIIANVGISIAGENEDFFSKGRWYLEGTQASTSMELKNTIEKRFAAYFAAGGKTEADNLLRKLKVQNGFAGLDFSESYVDSNGDLYIIVTYKIDYIFDYPAFNLEPISMRQEVVSHIWK